MIKANGGKDGVCYHPFKYYVKSDIRKINFFSILRLVRKCRVANGEKNVRISQGNRHCSKRVGYVID